MKKKLLFLQCLMLGIVLVCSVGAMAQAAPEATLSGDPNSITPVIFTGPKAEIEDSKVKTYEVSDPTFGNI